MAGIGMNKGRGVARAKAGIRVPRKTGAQAPSVANGSKFKQLPGGPTPGAKKRSPSSANMPGNRGRR